MCVCIYVCVCLCQATGCGKHRFVFLSLQRIPALQQNGRKCPSLLIEGQRAAQTGHTVRAAASPLTVWYPHNTPGGVPLPGGAPPGIGNMPSALQRSSTCFGGIFRCSGGARRVYFSLQYRMRPEGGDSTHHWVEFALPVCESQCWYWVVGCVRGQTAAGCNLSS